jgi:hypothetical protein
MNLNFHGIVLSLALVQIIPRPASPALHIAAHRRVQEEADADADADAGFEANKFFEPELLLRTL